MRINKKAMAGAITGAAAAALVVVAITGSNVANAVDTTPSPSTTQSAPTAPQAPRAPQEEALTGDTADKVKAAVEAKYPGATIDRMEKDSHGGGVYEAHITKADGTRARIALDADFAVTGEQTGRPGGGMGHGPQEEALTGDTADKVKAAVEAKYPGATVDRSSKESDGTAAYEAHVTKADGTHVKVLLDATFAVTGEETGHMGGPGRHGGPGDRDGGPGGRGDHDGGPMMGGANGGETNGSTPTPSKTA